MLPPQVGSQPSILAMTSIIANATMSFDDRYMFETFSDLGSPRFSSILGENAYEFQIYYYEKLYNVQLLESHSIASTTYALREATWNLYRLLVSCRLLGLSEIAWVHYIKAFWERFVIYRLRKHLRDVFDEFQLANLNGIVRGVI